MSIHSIIAWSLILGLGLAAAILSVNAREPVGLLAAAAIVNGLLAVAAVSQRRALAASGASRSRVESHTARYMGLIWLWGAAALFAVYFFILSWREWPHFTAAFALAGALCLGYSALLAKDAGNGRDDPTMLKLGRYLGIGQLAGMLVTMAGLAIDPDKEFLTTADADWAGNGIFLFGALALAIVSAQALIDGKKISP